LSGVWGSATEVWAVGDKGTVLRNVLSGGGFNSVGVPAAAASTNLSAVYSPAASESWVVGAAGTILHFTSGSFTALASGTTKNLSAVFGTGPDNLWAVGDTGTILRY